jgi:DNA-binding response OmpR family regulator
VPPRPPTVLLAEDDEATRLFFAQVLTRHGHLVVSAPTGRDAIAACRDRAEPIDVVLLDVHLPDMSGVDLCARLGEMRSDLQVVVCSGEATRGEAVRLHGMGVLRFLRKPVGPDELLATVEAALR